MTQQWSGKKASELVLVQYLRSTKVEFFHTITSQLVYVHKGDGGLRTGYKTETLELSNSFFINYIKAGWTTMTYRFWKKWFWQVCSFLLRWCQQLWSAWMHSSNRNNGKIQRCGACSGWLFCTGLRCELLWAGVKKTEELTWWLKVKHHLQIGFKIYKNVLI